MCRTLYWIAGPSKLRKNSEILVSDLNRCAGATASRDGHPLRLDLESVDLGEELVVRVLDVVVGDDEVEVVSEPFLHLARLLDDVLRLAVLRTQENYNNVHNKNLTQLTRSYFTKRTEIFDTFFLIRSCSRSRSMLGGAMKTTYGFSSDAFKILKDCKKRH